MEIRPTSSVSAAQPLLEDRSNLLRDLATLTLEATHGIQRMNDQQVTQLLGGLVKSKLMSADDSYLLRDRLLDQSSINRAIDERIEAALRRRGLLTEEVARQIRGNA